MKKFCIICPDYEFHVPRSSTYSIPSINAGLRSLANQTLKDFNIVICHDGPKILDYADEGVDFKKIGIDPIIINTPKRLNNWGHGSRDFAMRYAYKKNLGEYYISLNIDNILYGEALETIYNNMEDDVELYTYDIYHHKNRELLYGNNPVVYGIDAMQPVVHKDIWKEENFWYTYEGHSDGIIYEKMFKNRKWKNIPFLLGENF